MAEEGQQQIRLNPLPEYEMKLLHALSFFLDRKVTSQAAAALCMYLRQSHDRILSQCEYYGHQTGMNKWDVLDLIYTDPEQARHLLQGRGSLHGGAADVFGDETERLVKDIENSQNR